MVCQNVFQKVSTSNKVCQFSALQCIFSWGYLEKPTTDKKHIHKRVRIFMHKTMCVSKIRF